MGTSPSIGPSRTLVRTGPVTVGQFRCAPSFSNFREAGVPTRHCFVFPRRGVWIQHEGAPAFVADSTKITLYNPQQPFERRAIHPDGDHSDWITLSEEIVRDVVARHDPAAADSPTRQLRYAYAPSHPQVYLAQRRLHEYLQRAQSPDLLFVEESAITLFAEIIDGLYTRVGVKAARPPRELPQRQRELVEAVCAHLNRTFTENHSFSALARTFDTSIFHLCRVFRRVTGLTMHAYRHELRLRHALECLTYDPDLLTLALDLGYSSHSHFTAVFRRQFGEVPSRLRGWPIHPRARS